MGLLAALAVALSALCATAAAGGVTALTWHVAPWLYAAGLAPGLGLVITRGAAWSRPRGKGHEAVFSVVLIVSAVLVIAGFSGGARSLPTAPAAAVGVVLMSVYWPDPLALGFGILASFVYLVTGRHGDGAVAWTAAAVAAGAFAAVAVARLYRGQLPTYGGARVLKWRGTALDGAIVLTVAAIFGAVLAAVLPPPPPNTGGGEEARLGQGALNPLSLGVQLNLAEARKAGDDRVVLRVAAPGPDVWRAATFETWTGRNWRLSEVPAAQNDPRGAADFRVPLGPGDVVADAPPFVQRVTVETDYTQVAVAAPVATRVVAPEHGYALGYAGIVVLGPAVLRHASYVVESSSAPASADVMRAHDPLAAPIPHDLMPYVATPARDDRISELATAVTSSALGAYDKVVSVAGWLAANTTARDVDESVPEGADVVAHFLFVDHGGRVERAATAMIVMLRTLGIPARLGVGFRPGERSGPSDPFTVRASDAAAWVEVWFPGAGWQRFDPTGSLAPRTSRESPSIWSRLWDLVSQWWPALLLLAVGLAALFVLVGFRRRRAAEAQPWPTRFYDRLLRAGAKRDRPRRPHETPVEYATALSESALPDPRLVQVGQLVTSAAFSGRAPTAEEQRWAERVLEDATSKSSRTRSGTGRQ